MANPDRQLHSVSPVQALREIASAVPADCRETIIIIGSLAAGYHYFADQDRMAVRTNS